MRSGPRQFLLLSTAVVLLAGVACSPLDDDSSPVTMAAVTPTSEPTNPAATATARSEDPSPTPSGEASPPPTEDDGAETPEARGDLAGAFAAASEALGVPAGDACSGDESGDCIRELPDGETDTSGPMTMLGYMSGGGGGALVLLGRDGAGVWQFWMLTQIEPYFLTHVPGDLRVCPDGASETTRSAPSLSSDPVEELARDVVAEAEAFVLTEPGTLDGPGAGWYRLAGDHSGWIRSTSTASADTGDCSRRDDAEGNSGSVG